LKEAHAVNGERKQGNMKSSGIISTIVLLVSLSLSDVVWACSCEKTTPAQVFDAAAIVFSGTAIVVKEDEVGMQLEWPDGRLENVGKSEQYRVKFKIEKLWKGDPAAEVVIFSPPSGMCTLPFIQGETYLVYAYRNKTDELETNDCFRTTLYKNAAKDIEALKKINEESQH
jgi:hypothetical protein